MATGFAVLLVPRRDYAGIAAARIHALRERCQLEGRALRLIRSESTYGPHTEDFYGFFGIIDLIHKTVLNVDAGVNKRLPGRQQVFRKEAESGMDS